MQSGIFTAERQVGDGSTAGWPKPSGILLRSTAAIGPARGCGPRPVRVRVGSARHPWNCAAAPALFAASLGCKTVTATLPAELRRAEER